MFLVIVLSLVLMLISQAITYFAVTNKIRVIRKQQKEQAYYLAEAGIEQAYGWLGRTNRANIPYPDICGYFPEIFGKDMSVGGEGTYCMSITITEVMPLHYDFIIVSTGTVNGVQQAITESGTVNIHSPTITGLTYP